MGDLASFLPGFTPIGGIIPVSNGFNLAGSPNFKLADGSDITASAYPTLAAQLPAAVQTALKPVPGDNVALQGVAYGNNIYVAIPPAMNVANGLYFGTIWVSTDGAVWLPKRLNGFGQSVVLTAISFMNGKFYLAAHVSAGANYILSSTNGTDWQRVMLDYSKSFYYYDNGSGQAGSDEAKIVSFSYVNGTYVACNYVTASYWSSIQAFYQSTDGITWTINNNAPSKYMNSMAYGAGLYVTVCGDGTTFSSSNLTAWTSRSNAGTGAGGWNSVAFGNGAFVSVQGQSGSGQSTGYSTDGITWTQKAVSSSRYYKVIYANSLFVTVGINICLTSPDGITWTSRTVPGSTWQDVAYGPTYGFVAVQSTSGNVALNSVAGTTWTTTPLSPATTGYVDVCYGTALGYMAVTASGIPSVSSDGQTWTQKTTLAGLNSVACNPSGSIYVGLSVSGSGTVYSTTDGVTWTSRYAAPNNSSNRVRYCNDKFILLGSYSSNPVGGRIQWSYDGIKWNTADSGTISADNVLVSVGLNYADVAYGNGAYVVVGAGVSTTTPPVSGVETAYSAWSPDGISWNPVQNMPSRSIWTGVAFGNNVFVAISKRQRNQVGVGYTNLLNGTYGNFYGPNQFLGETGRCGREAAVSTNGVDWAPALLPFAADWTSITFNGHVFIAVAMYAGAYAISKDGFNWVVRQLPTNQMQLSVIGSGAGNTSIALPSAVSGFNLNAAAVRFTESATQVTLPYIRPSEGINYAVKVM